MSDIATTNSGGTHQKLSDFLRGANETYHHRDELLAEVADLRNRLAVADGMVAQLKEMLTKITADRDYHLRHSLALVTRLNVMLEMAGGLLEQSRHQADHPGPVVEPGNITSE